jgi:hypothetical protein
MNGLKMLLLVVVIIGVSPTNGQVYFTKKDYDEGLAILVSGGGEAHKVSASEVYIEYQKNGVAWEEKYSKKIRFLVGVVQSIGRDIYGQRNLLLKAHKPYKNLDHWETMEIMYPETLPDYLKQELASYKVGQTVEILVQFRNDPSISDAVYYIEESNKK